MSDFEDYYGGRSPYDYVPAVLRGRRKIATDRSKKGMRTWRVVAKDGNVHNIAAHFAFDNTNEGGGLIFRAYANKNDDRTYVVAAFNRDNWSHYQEVRNGDQI